jgi:two-component system copper resistance phosphate regulon response regulator CusR
MSAVDEGSLLLVEDDPSLGQRLRLGLRQEGYRVLLVGTGGEALEVDAREAFDLVILDGMLPDLDGLEVLRRLREGGRSIPVLMLTARGETEDRVRGLDAGADDYLVKPFALAELLARIRTLLRRTSGAREKKLSSGPLDLDLVARRVRWSGKALDLTPKEFELLACLLNLRGEIASRQMLVREVWQAQGRFTSLDNVIDVHMANLRRKLREVAGTDLVETVRGVGYRWRAPRAAGS